MILHLVGVKLVDFMPRKNLLVPDEVYHVFNKSIAGYKVFNDEKDFTRIQQMFRYYQHQDPPTRFSHFINSHEVRSSGVTAPLKVLSEETTKAVQIIAYCVMPTHIHLVLKQLTENGVSTFMSKVLNSFTRYFNEKHKRKGPLWEGRFKNVQVNSDDQLLHLTRYVHLNPVTAYLCERAEDWNPSSYHEYVGEIPQGDRFCSYEGLLDIAPKSYKRFVQDQIGYQRELAGIKSLLVDN